MVQEQQGGHHQLTERSSGGKVLIKSSFWQILDQTTHLRDVWIDADRLRVSVQSATVFVNWGAPMEHQKVGCLLPRYTTSDW